MLPIELVADAAEPSALASPTPVKVDKVDAGVQMDGAPVKVDKVDAGVQMDGAPVKVDKVDAGVQTDGVQGHQGQSMFKFASYHDPCHHCYKFNESVTHENYALRGPVDS